MFWGVFFADPLKDSFETFLGGPGGLETPVYMGAQVTTKTAKVDMLGRGNEWS